jgi:hypothetical protein
MKGERDYRRLGSLVACWYLFMCTREQLGWAARLLSHDSKVFLNTNTYPTEN